MAARMRSSAAPVDFVILPAGHVTLTFHVLRVTSDRYRGASHYRPFFQ